MAKGLYGYLIKMAKPHVLPFFLCRTCYSGLRYCHRAFRSGVNEMKQSSIVIHKGGKETKYEICVEDYVASYLKDETGTLELSEFYFYGYREKNGRRYVIYGAGRDRHLPVFAQYNLLEEIGCRLTQAGPVFLVREKDDIYETKGYDVFYQDNVQMQSYLIEQKNAQIRNEKAINRNSASGHIHTGGKRKYKTEKKKNRRINAVQTNAQKNSWSEGPHGLVSIQLGVILVALIAIVINSTNSYDKMEQLNQSASEVFFAIENQEAEDVKDAGRQDEIVVGRDILQENEKKKENLPEEGEPGQAQTDAGQEDILKLVALENDGGVEESENFEDGAMASASDSDIGNEKSDVETGGENDGAEEDAGSSTEEGANKPQGEDMKEKEKAEGETQQEGELHESGQDLVNHEGKDGAGNQGETEGKQEDVEALSRNVTRYYEVERGDTLYTISQKIYGDESHVKKICELNQITNPDNIRYGQKIILP